jgi:cellulose synthase/poly-beta-1,6-N-acetylglucosamine synthase-like glycosyltransferase
MINYLCLLIICIHLLDCLRHLTRLRNTLRWLTSSQSQPSPQSHKTLAHNTLCILIPVYNEGEVIESSVGYFAPLCQRQHVALYYISTQKEGNNGPTIQALNRLQGQHAFTWLHYPKSQGNKADQLNWAIDHIMSMDGLSEHTRMYFGIYDIDSRPEPAVIEHMLFACDQVYQQPAIFLENYQQLGVFQRAGALLQTKWELERNIPVLRSNQQRSLHGLSPTSLNPCTGHGLFVRADLLQHGSLFRTDTLTEDLELGYRLTFEGIPITALPLLDLCEYAPTPFSTITQARRWFSGEFHLYRYYLRAQHKAFFLRLVLKRYYLTFKWALGAPLLGVAMVLLTSHIPAAIILPLISLLLYIIVPLRWLSHFPRWRTSIGQHSALFPVSMAAIVRPLFNSLGPLSYLLGNPLHLFKKELPTFIKTPRTAKTIRTIHDV